MNGIIRSIDGIKQYGFIKVDGTTEHRDEYFFHREDFLGFFEDLVFDFNKREGSIQVEFTADKTPKGLRARNVKRLDFPNQAV